jgi:hypothetical protein
VRLERGTSDIIWSFDIRVILVLKVLLIQQPFLICPVDVVAQYTLAIRPHSQDNKNPCYVTTIMRSTVKREDSGLMKRILQHSQSYNIIYNAEINYT